MNEVVIDLKTNKNRIEIVPLGDFHIGDENCNIDEIKKTIDYIAYTDNCYTILNGDLMNNALKTSKSDTYKESMSIGEEQDLLIELLTPIKDKILYMTTGNHEYRTSILSGIDPSRAIARELGLIKKGLYGDNDYFITLMFGIRNGDKKLENTYTIFGMHGSGGGRRMGATANVLEDMSAIVPNADLYIHSHTHNPMTFRKPIFVYNINNKKLEKIERTFYNTNSFLEYGGYAERKGYTPTDNTANTIVIFFARYKGEMIKRTEVCKL